MTKIFQYAGQIVIYGAIAVFIGYFSLSPKYQYFPDDKAQIKVSFVHGGARMTECRKRTREELQELNPNMRTKTACERERVPLVFEFDLDGKPMERKVLQPAGLSSDGPGKIYEKYEVEPGEHELEFRMRDSRRKTGFDHVHKSRVVLEVGQNLSVDFLPNAGGFVAR